MGQEEIISNFEFRIANLRKRRKQRFSCGSGFQPRSYDLNDLNDFNDFNGLNDLPFTADYWILSMRISV